VAPVVAFVSFRFGDTDGVRRNGPTDPSHRLASHVHVTVEGVDGEALLWALDSAGVRVSTGSACVAGAASPSHVAAALGIDDGAILRASLGWTSTADDVAAGVIAFQEAVAKLRAVGGGGVG